MLDTRSKYKKVDDEKRKHPRLELHCKAVVRGMNGIFTVTDISLGGVFLEPQDPVIVKIGQLTDIKIKLPEASHSIQIQVRFANQTKRGIGCEFINLSPANKDLIEDCIDTFRCTMPIIKDRGRKTETEPQTPKQTIQCPQCKRVKSVLLPRRTRGSLKAKIKCSCGHQWSLAFETGSVR